MRTAYAARAAIVIYDGNCGFCDASRRVVERFDWAGRFEWKPFQSGADERFGIPLAALVERLHLIQNGHISTGFRACKRILAQLPATYAAIGLALLLPGPSWQRLALAGLAAAFFSPLSNPLGETAYMWAANRRSSACKTQPSPK